MTRPTYYSENDPYAAAWLRNLVGGGLLPDGVVDDRDVRLVEPDDLREFGACHFFAGIGGWALAAEYARVDASARPLWSASLPCQPFSGIGRGEADEDGRHLWPAFFRLVREVRPRTIAGERVASAIGGAWLDHVLADLEGVGYACAAADLSAGGFGAPHVRRRLYWVADRPVADADRPGLEGLRPHGDDRDEPGRDDAEEARSAREGREPLRWGSGLRWLGCSDGFVRPTGPGVLPLADGIPARVGRVRAYGNAVVPLVAAEFLAAVFEARP